MFYNEKAHLECLILIYNWSAFFYNINVLNYNKRGINSPGIEMKSIANFDRVM